MCRNIKPLFNFEPPADSDEIGAAALQFVRKISGFTKPSAVNQDAFDLAVAEVATAATRLLDRLETSAEPKNRDVEAQKRKAISLRRFGAA